jgi:hypothetical protein
MIEIQTNVDEAAEQIELRVLWRSTMTELSKKDAIPTTYLGLQMVAPDVAAGGRFGVVKPMVTGATEVPVALPASGPWAGDPCGDELPLGFSIEEVGALGGAGGSHESMSGRVEIAAPAQVSGADSGE